MSSKIQAKLSAPPEVLPVIHPFFAQIQAKHPAPPGILPGIQAFLTQTLG